MKSTRIFRVVILGLLAWYSCASVFGKTLYVVQDNVNAMAPYTNWATAAATIQQAIDVAEVDDTVLVTNGVYATGGRVTPGASLTNRIVVTNAIIVRSVNGPSNTVICGQGPRGDNAVRCAYLANGAMLCGFTLSNGCTRTSGDYSKDMNGGGVYAANAVVSNCLITGNSASYGGGGTYGGTVNNCIVYYNSANSGANFFTRYGAYAYSCTTPNPGGVGNITAEPQLASASHLSPDSPCIGAGNYAICGGVDIDGETWLNPPCMGCDQVAAGGVTGSLSVAIGADAQTVAVGWSVKFTGWIEGKPAGCLWTFGDGVRVTNQPYTAHAWSATGEYAVILTAWNDTDPAGVTATVTVWVVEQAVHYVNESNPNPLPPYVTWKTAATDIQNAIDVCSTGDAVVVNGRSGFSRMGCKS